ncbi:MAG: hypothetical protein OHK0017_12860 [Patescibacteria group bacterium]
MPINQILSGNSNKNQNKGPVLPQANTTEFILVPDLDVMDTEEIDESGYEYSSEPMTYIDPNPIPAQPETPIPSSVPSGQSFAQQVEDSAKAEGQLSHNEHHEKLKVLTATSWVLITFLMTTVILGGVYFYFTYEDQRAKISSLERQLATATIKTPEVKGANENNSSDQDLDETQNNNSVKPVAVGDNISIKDNSEFSNKFTFAEETTSIPYFKNQSGVLSKYYYIQPTTKTLKDGITVYSLENDGSFDEKQLLRFVQQSDVTFKISPVKKTSSNGVELTAIESTKDTKTKYYVGQSTDFMYVVVWNNQSMGNSATTNLNNYLKNILDDLVLN